MYEAKNYERLLGTEGFSDVILRNHFTLYEGYVSNVNKISDLLKSIELGTPAYNELKRRFGWEWSGMRLHELYFGNMIIGGCAPLGSHKIRVSRHSSGDPSVNSEFVKRIIEDFGSFEKWEKDFKSTGVLRGIGWVVLAQDPENGHLFNTWVNEHDCGHLVGAKIILVMDVFEHAFVLDYGINRTDYISSFWKVIDWSVVERRFAGN